MPMFETLMGHDHHAITLLKRDHVKVKDLFDEFDDASTLAQKLKIAAEVINELKAHAAVEEEIFYPAVWKAAGDKVMNEAEVEHHVAKLLIAELEKMTGHEDLFEAKFTVLAENIRHHIKEEESRMLPEAADAEIDFDAMGEEMLARKEELLRKGFPVLPEEKLIGVRGKERKVTAVKRSKAHIAGRKNHSERPQVH
jgi:hypothetical protein